MWGTTIIILAVLTVAAIVNLVRAFWPLLRGDDLWLRRD